jgi:hypothetical protein
MTLRHRSYKTRISDPEDFGLFFNCLTRRYLWDYDEDLLDLMIRIMDRYLTYFSQRTLICSIEDLTEGDRNIWRMERETVPENQQERYDHALMALVRRLKFIEQEEMDRGDEIPQRRSTTLPFRKSFLPDFLGLCVATLQYSYGRRTYMPGTCRDFILHNITLLSDAAIDRIIHELEDLLLNRPISAELGGVIETEEWDAFKVHLLRERIARDWFSASRVAAQEDPDAIPNMISDIGRLEAYPTESACLDALSRLDGIDCFLRDKACALKDRSSLSDQLDLAKKQLSQRAFTLWEKENAGKYVKVGPNLYRRSD